MASQAGARYRRVEQRVHVDRVRRVAQGGLHVGDVFVVSQYSLGDVRRGEAMSDRKPLTLAIIGIRNLGEMRFELFGRALE